VHHYIAQLSLIGGWLPIAVQLLAGIVLVCAIRWRSRLWLAIVLGAALAVLAHWYLGSVGVAGDSAPWAVWLWIAATGVAVVTSLTWGGVRWSRRGLAVLAVPLCVLSCGLAVNRWVGYFPTVHAAWSQLTAGPLPDQTDRLTVTAMQLKGVRPANGVVVPVTVSADASKFTHRGELVYLPPAWFAHNPPPRLPTVMMIGSELNTTADWLRAGNAVHIADDFAAAHNGFAPVLVFVDPTGAFSNDTECVNGSRGNAADHLTKDVVPYMISNFGVSRDRINWGIVGWSMGGTCAVDLTVMHPDMFSAFVDVAGDLSPNSGNKDQTVAWLFGGDAKAWAEFDPTTVMTRHGPYNGVSGWFEIPGAPVGGKDRDVTGNPEGQDLAANSLCGLGSAEGIQCAVVTQPGKHDWPFAASAFANALPWLAGQLGTPGVPRIPLPGRVPAAPVDVGTSICCRG
jgi:S-formylglutathione hydrolase FrmB